MSCQSSTTASSPYQPIESGWSYAQMRSGKPNLSGAPLQCVMTMSPGWKSVTRSPTSVTSPNAELPGNIFPPRASAMFTVSAVAAWSMLCSADAARMRMWTSRGPTSRSSSLSSSTTFETSMFLGSPPTRSRSRATASAVIQKARTVRAIPHSGSWIGRLHATRGYSEHTKRVDVVALAAGQGPEDGDVAMAVACHGDEAVDGDRRGQEREAGRVDVHADGEIVGVDGELDQAGGEVVIEPDDATAEDA